MGFLWTKRIISFWCVFLRINLRSCVSLWSIIHFKRGSFTRKPKTMNHSYLYAFGGQTIASWRQWCCQPASTHRSDLALAVRQHTESFKNTGTKVKSRIKDKKISIGCYVMLSTIDYHFHKN